MRGSRSAPPQAFRLRDLFEPALYRVPVDDVPPGLEVVGPAVLVLQVVGVLPDVDAEQWGVGLRDRRVLVSGRVDGKARPVMDEPGPARAEALDACLVHG